MTAATVTAIADVRPMSPSSHPPLVIGTTDNRLEYISRHTGRWLHASIDGVGGAATYRTIPRDSDVDMNNANVVETHDGSLQLFASGDGVIWTTRQQGKNGAWSGWSLLGGNSYGLPIAVTRGKDEALSLFSTGTDGTLWTSSQRGASGPWSPWVSLGGTRLTSAPSVGRGVGDALEVVVNASDGATWKISQATGGGVFGAWQRFSEPGFTNGYLNDPQVITRADRSLEVVLRRADGTIATRRQAKPAGTWQNWETLAGHTGHGRPAVVLEPSGMLTVLSVGSGARISRGRFGVDPTVAAQGWDDLGQHGAPLGGGNEEINGAGLANGTWAAVYLDESGALAEVNSGGGDAGDAAPPKQAPKLRDLASLRGEHGRSGTYSEGQPTSAPQMGATWTPPDFKYDHFTFEQCRNPDAGDNPPGQVKNHYSYCWSGNASINYKMHCWGSLCFGRRVVYLVTVIGEGNTHSRESLYRVFVSDFEDVSPTDRLMKVKVEMRCDSLVQPDDCKPESGSSSTERSIADWEANDEARMKVVGAEPAVAEHNPDRLGYGNAWVHVTATAPNNSRRDIDTPRNRVRFDSADYLKYNAFTGGQGAIFPDVNAVINFPIGTPGFAAMQASGLHYKQALERPDETYPRVAGKRIPGAVGGSPLHRLFYDKDRRKENRDTAHAACTSELPPGEYPKPDHQCDEYPFATTSEGASQTYNPLRNFSVKSIHKDDNEAAGSWLGAWYSYDRIVDGDPFYVRVTL
ncbi:NucA/NucB deoxyribonuclease domain-containing protein [Lentzea sp.]|uniref:NucA/NucB deoxyribonuclease domain-containing protein n=1 Tax=Lentzea sp. TaxID=56099 RepID=UPI002CE7781D|nr:NucA/NucB deoxyribonuclease domain-containing protein [Lentzea sp.]HUQ54885.1 NucA/NucB deoxyribonuclease domain-containing protein [Lentzea sp.]